MENQERKAYLTIGSVRALDIRVIFENTEILYEGAVEEAPEEIKKLRIADIACGSGIFLTEVLDYLINYCQDWYEKNKKYDNLEETYTNTYKLTYKEKEEIKKLRYSKVENSDKMNFYVYNCN